MASSFSTCRPVRTPSTGHKRVMDTLVARGLRAELKTGNLISGSLYRGG